jgi:outer membrane receptor protein involved in Fe transport
MRTPTRLTGCWAIRRRRSTTSSSRTSAVFCTAAARRSSPCTTSEVDIAAYYRNDNAQLDYNVVMSFERAGALVGVERLDQRARQWGSFGTTDNDESVTSYDASTEIDVNPSYVRVDAVGRFRFTGALNGFLRVENLFDREIIEDLGYQQPGRYAVAGLQYSFF